MLERGYAMQVLLPPAQSGGSEASTRSQPSAPRRSIKAAEPKVKEHRDAAVRARNARNQHLHRQRQKVSAEAFSLSHQLAMADACAAQHLRGCLGLRVRIARNLRRECQNMSA